MHIRTIKEEKEEHEIFFNVMEALKKAKALQCDNCGKNCDKYSIALGIDYENILLTGRSCMKCWHDFKYGGLNKKEFDFVMQLEDVQSNIQRFSELIEMKPKKRFESMNNQLRALKGTLSDLEKEAVKMNLKGFIR